MPVCAAVQLQSYNSIVKGALTHVEVLNINLHKKRDQILIESTGLEKLCNQFVMSDKLRHNSFGNIVICEPSPHIVSKTIK